jgi:hypothetical protein
MRDREISVVATAAKEYAAGKAITSCRYRAAKVNLLHHLHLLATNSRISFNSRYKYISELLPFPPHPVLTRRMVV